MNGNEVELFGLSSASRGRQVSEFLFQQRPTSGPDFVRYQLPPGAPVAFIHRRVLDQMRESTLRALPNETIGVLLGRVCQDDRGAFLLVMGASTAAAQEHHGTPGGVRISVAGKATLVARAAREWPGFEVVGWWHSHPHGAPRFSHEDFNEQAVVGTHHVGIVTAAEWYRRASSEDFQDPISVYLGPQGKRLIALDHYTPPKTLSPPPPLKPEALPTASANSGSRQPLVAVGVLLLAIVLTAWWTQHEVGIRTTTVTTPAPPVRVIAKTKSYSNEVTLIQLQTCIAGETRTLHLYVPRSLTTGLLATSDSTNIAIPRLSGNGSELSISCITPGQATISLTSNGVGSSVDVPVVVKNPPTDGAQIP